MSTYTDTAGENLVAGNLCYRKSDGKLWKAKGDAAATMPAVSMAAESISADAAGEFYAWGEVTSTSHGLTVGKLLFVSAATAGLMVIDDNKPSDPGEQVQVVGQVVDADT